MFPLFLNPPLPSLPSLAAKTYITLSALLQVIKVFLSWESEKASPVSLSNFVLPRKSFAWNGHIKIMHGQKEKFEKNRGLLRRGQGGTTRDSELTFCTSESNDSFYWGGSCGNKNDSCYQLTWWEATHQMFDNPNPSLGKIWLPSSLPLPTFALLCLF